MDFWQAANHFSKEHTQQGIFLLLQISAKFSMSVIGQGLDGRPSATPPFLFLVNTKIIYKQEGGREEHFSKLVMRTLYDEHIKLRNLEISPSFFC